MPYARVPTSRALNRALLERQLLLRGVRATLRVVPLEPLGRTEAAAVEEEAARVLAFVAPGDGEVQLLPAGSGTAASSAKTR